MKSREEMLKEVLGKIGYTVTNDQLARVSDPTDREQVILDLIQSKLDQAIRDVLQLTTFQSDKEYAMILCGGIMMFLLSTPDKVQDEVRPYFSKIYPAMLAIVALMNKSLDDDRRSS